MSKPTNHQRGLRAELAAMIYLACKGYRLVTRRYKTRHGEIDLIMRRRRSLLFVEVKARPTHEDAAFAIHEKNRARVMQAAQVFLASHPSYCEYDIRFDAVLIAWYRWPRHLVHAFSAPI